MYAISRRDLPLAQQAVQSGHAVSEHAYSFGRPADHHPTHLYLTVRDKDALEARKHALNSAGIRTCEFHEPYKDWGLTAFACLVTEEHRHLFQDLPLWKVPNIKESAHI